MLTRSGHRVGQPGDVQPVCRTWCPANPNGPTSRRRRSTACRRHQAHRGTPVRDLGDGPGKRLGRIVYVGRLPGMHPTAGVEIQLLGPVGIRTGDGAVLSPSRTAVVTLLAVLAIEAGTPVSENEVPRTFRTVDLLGSIPGSEGIGVTGPQEIFSRVSG